MNINDLETYAQLLGVPVSAVIIATIVWLTVGKWLRDVIIPRWLEAQELQAKAMVDISQIVLSLQHEVRETRRVSDENASRLAKIDVRMGQWETRPANGRARKVGDP